MDDILSQVIAYAPNRIDTETKARAMVQGPRNMYAYGQLVSPSVDGSRTGYSGEKFNISKINKLRKQGKTASEIQEKLKYNKTAYENFVKANKNKLVPVSSQKIGSGKFSLAELNRVARIKYPNIGSYAKLNSGQKSNVTGILKNASVSGSKITKKTKYTPLTEIQQNKILAEFPDADFSQGKFGFNRIDNQASVTRVQRFIKRGYKPKFNTLPLKVQNQLKEKFSEITNWDFKKYKYGFPMPAKPPYGLGIKIKNFVAEPKPYMFGFSLDRPGAWMTVQMYRAWEHGNTDYEPIYNKNDKVIGMKENGKAYYANENVAPSNKVKLINSHPEFNKVQKFVDVANEAKLPLKDLGGYKNTKSLIALFPEGYESIKFSDLTNYLYNKAGVVRTRNAIEKHHLKNLADMGAPIDSKNLQLLRKDLNTLGNTITQQIKKGDLSRVGDLEKAGVKIVVDGKTYGTGFQDPRLQMNRIIGDVTQKVSSLDEKTLKSLLVKLCPKGKASGGRIGFKSGTPTVGCGQKQLQKLLFKGGGTEVERGLVQRIVSGGGKFALSMLNPAELIKLKNLVGPAALGIMGAYEAGSITDDVLRLNKPLDEALAGNWLTKAFMPYSEEFAKQKNLLQSGQLTGNQREYALEMMKMEEFMKEGKRIEGLEANKLVEGTLDDDFTFTSDEDMNKAYNDLFGKFIRLKPYAYEDGITGRSLENEAAMNEYEDAQTARTGASKIFGGPQRLVNKAPRPKNMTRGPMTEKGRMKLDYHIPGYTPYDQAYTPSDEEILNIYKKQGYVHPRFGQLEPGEGTKVRMGLAMNDGNRSIFGSKFSEGGITGLRSKYEYKK